jgi:hypothetical protein
MPHRNNFLPGNKANLRLLLQKEFLRTYFNAFNTAQTTDNILNSDQITQDSLCNCFPFRSNVLKQGYLDPGQVENKRVASILTGTLGGKITFGNMYRPANLNYLGSWEGQPGGSFKPLRNKF